MAYGCIWLLGAGAKQTNRLVKQDASQSQCFASDSQCAVAQTWPIRRQLRPAAQSCRLPCPLKGALRRWQGNQHHCLSVIDGQRVQSVGKAEYRHAKALGFGSLTHRAGYAIASSVTMRHFLSRAFVKKSHIVTCHQFDSRLSQSVAKAEYRHCQVAHKSSPVASQRWQHERRGAGYGSRLAGASCWHPGSTAVGRHLGMHQPTTHHCG